LNLQGWKTVFDRERIMNLHVQWLVCEET